MSRLRAEPRALSTGREAVQRASAALDVAHFRPAWALRCDPEDQAPLPRPRPGFYGVIDERLDLELINAARRCGRNGSS